MEIVAWRGELLFCSISGPSIRTHIFPLDQFSSTELSEMMETFYICTVQSDSHSLPIAIEH